MRHDGHPFTGQKTDFLQLAGPLRRCLRRDDLGTRQDVFKGACARFIMNDPNN